MEHPCDLAERIGDLLFDDRTSDMMFIVEGVPLPAHRAILITSCEYFRYSDMALGKLSREISTCVRFGLRFSDQGENFGVISSNPVRSRRPPRKWEMYGFGVSPVAALSLKNSRMKFIGFKSEDFRRWSIRRAETNQDTDE